MIPVVILAAGEGQRLGPVGKLYRKALLPVGDRTLLAHHLQTFLALGARRFVLVVSPEAEDLAAEAARVLAPSGIRPQTVIQEQRRGIGHAVLAAQAVLNAGPFVLVLGDTYYAPKDLAPAAAAVAAGEFEAVLSVRRVDDEDLIRKECTIALDSAGLVRRIVEKPAQVLSPLKPCGVYFFGARIWQALQATPASALRGEVELTDAIQRLIDDGGRVGVRETLYCDVNITFPADVLAANLAWLRQRRAPAFVDPRAALGQGARVEDCVVAAGARVGAGARLRRVVVFPEAEVRAGQILEDALAVAGVGSVDARGHSA